MFIGRKLARVAIHDDAVRQPGSRRRIAAAISSGVFVLVGLSAAPAAYAGSASAADCTPQGVVKVPGGEARWTKCLGDGWTSVDGWVRDTKEDGKCAEVFARFANGTPQTSNRACPSGEVERFNWKESGRGVSVLLRTVPTG